VRTDAVQSLLSAFDRFTPEEQREAVSEILRRTSDLEWPPVDDDTIDRIGEETFLELDSREAADAEQ
jgi:hypothetical protein